MAALALAEQDLDKTWEEITGIERALRDRPQTAAEALLERAGRHQHIAALAEQQIADEETESTRDLKCRLALAQDILEDRRRVWDDLKARIEKFDSQNYALDRAKTAARNVIHDETGEYVTRKIADIQAATMTLIQARADLTWFQSHAVFGQFDHNLPQTLREALHPYQDAADQMARAARASSAWVTVIDDLLADPAMPLPLTGP